MSEENQAKADLPMKINEDDKVGGVSIRIEQADIATFCEHKWRCHPMMMFDVLKINKVYRTCSECGIHQKGEITWSDQP